MKLSILKLSLYVSAFATVSTHAMLSRASLSILRSGGLDMGYRIPTPGSEQPLPTAKLPLKAKLLAQSLITQKSYKHTNSKDEYQSGDFGSNDNKQYFFGYAPKAVLGLSLFGYSFLNSDDAICQTPEDFHNTEKLQQTREFAQSNGNDRIFELFIEKFDVLKKDPVAKEKVLEFLAITYDSIKHDPHKVQNLKRIILADYKSFHANKWGKQVIKKIVRHQQETFGVTERTTFKEWKSICDNLPASNKYFMHSALSKKEFKRIVAEYKNYAQKEPNLSDAACWLGTMPEHSALCGSMFTPYAQKMIVKPGSHVAFHGDLHGDVHALNNFLAHLQKKGYLNDNFTIIRDDFYMVFLGDYTDRGYYGAEVWYTILRLKLANKDRVVLVRGNHEDKKLNTKYGFNDELKAKFAESRKDTCYQELYNLYNFFPVALYLGCGTKDAYNYLLCCHGGLELGFDPQPLLQDKRTKISTLVLNEQNMIDRSIIFKQLSKQTQEAILQKIPTKYLEPFCVTNPYYMGFMWNDFIVKPERIVDFGSRGWKCGKQLTKELLNVQSTKEHAVRGVFRAHQHFDPQMMARILNRDKKGNPIDIGVGKIWTDHAKIKKAEALWNGIVCTFLVTPAILGKRKESPFNFDAFGILITARTFENWKLKMIRLDEHQDQDCAQ